MKQVRYRGLKYATGKQNFGNSLVMFSGKENTEPVPGSIRDIYQHTRLQDGKTLTEIFISVAPLATAPEMSSNPFVTFPWTKANVWGKEFQEDTETIRLDQIASHFALGPWDSCSIVLPLSRE